MSSSTLEYVALKDQISHDIIIPSYLRDVKDFTEGRFQHREWGYRYEAIGKIFTGLSTTVAFLSSGFPDFKYGGLIAGVLGVIALMMQQFASFNLSRSRENTEQLKQTIQSIDRHSIILPDVIQDDDVGEEDKKRHPPPPPISIDDSKTGDQNV